MGKRASSKKSVFHKGGIENENLILKDLLIPKGQTFKMAPDEKAIWNTRYGAANLAHRQKLILHSKNSLRAKAATGSRVTATIIYSETEEYHVPIPTPVPRPTPEPGPDPVIATLLHQEPAVAANDDRMVMNLDFDSGPLRWRYSILSTGLTSPATRCQRAPAACRRSTSRAG